MIMMGSGWKLLVGFVGMYRDSHPTFSGLEYCFRFPGMFLLGSGRICLELVGWLRKWHSFLAVPFGSGGRNVRPGYSKNIYFHHLFSFNSVLVQFCTE